MPNQTEQNFSEHSTRHDYNKESASKSNRDANNLQYKKSYDAQAAAVNLKPGHVNSNQESKIVRVKKNQDGDITDVMLENGNIYSLHEAVMMAKDGLLADVNVGTAKNGKEFLRSNANGNPNDNLDNLPLF